MATMTIKNITLDLDKKLCYVEGNLINLTKNEYLLLNFLLNEENRNRVFSRQELLNAVWDTKVSLRTVDTTVSRLRKKLGDSGKYITTRLGFGYGFIDN